ncbi:ATP-binding protein [Thermococcus gammatolerans]|uniref:Prokaryotic ATPase, AAA superfamily n=1 Tax=Thermococcus gammatolerans (strain DSM 15229 / JCM 11827 / EJ3) TaxID=593117 RepID=C5A765_THEGJ|nr:ATP-binding protein [Thermococcus gammatolerans]ACS34077.1 Prokaryotic ATPase, AAA superfamily [Thermococcus gammatolerans EJ3]
MMQQFVNRKGELDALRRAFEGDKAELIVVYGRRRVGKTALVLKAAEGFRHVYFLADERSEAENLAEFRKKVAQFLGDEVVARSDLGWIEVFRLIAERGNGVVMIDELPYLVEGNPAFPSVLQKAWDLHLQNSKVKLVLVGSSIGMMERLLGHKSPLYGRRTMQIDLKPLRYWHVPEFLPGYSPEDWMRVYGVADGIPLYLKQFDGSSSFWENVGRLFLRKESPLYTEAEFLLRQEFREPARYFSILKAIAFGKTSFGEIVNFTAFDRGTVSRYLDNLARIRVIAKVHPAFEPEKRRNTRYEFADNYFRFWFRFVYPNRERIERELYTEVLKDVKANFDHYMGPVFERAAEDFLWRRFAFERGGRWWRRGEEVDFVGVKNGTAYFFEAKWGTLDHREALRVLKRLEEKAENVRTGAKKRCLGIVARAVEDRERLEERGFLVFELRDLFGFS